MANVVEGSGTQTATINTEHSLLTDSDGKTFVLLVDTVNMANGDVLELRAKAMVLSGGTRRQLYMATYRDVQSDPIKASIPLVAPGHTDGVEFTLKQTAGTGRSFPWAVVSVG